MSNSPTQKIFSRDIYHGLPDLSDAPRGMTAIVTGANGISGAHMIRVLASNHERWRKVYALSRRPPSGSWPETVEHVALDFLQSPEQIAKTLEEQQIKPDYIFFFSYVLLTDDTGALQWGDQKLVDKNNVLLDNFLQALPLAGNLPRRIFVQYGQKWYGVHLGPTDIPDEETDPRLDVEPNLYYTQQDILTSFCSRHQIGWNAGLPSFIIGAALDSSQSLMFPIFVYASVQKYLGRELQWPSDLAAWYAPQSLSNAVLNSFLYEWSVLAPNTANQIFNVSDDCAFTWGRLWPRLAARYAIDYCGPDPSPTAEWKERRSKHTPAVHARGSPSVMRYKFSFVEWARDSQNAEAWKILASRHHLRSSTWTDIGSVFGRADFCLDRHFASVMSMSKGKKFGFHGFVDSYESIFSVLEEFVTMKIVPNPEDIMPAPQTQ